MKKLNNKGMTIVEILVCFVLVTAITASLYSTIAMYNTKKHEEDIKQAIYKYKILLSKEVYDDIIKRRVKNVSCNNNIDTKEVKFTYDYVSPKSLTFSRYNVKYGESGNETTYPLPKVAGETLEFELNNWGLSCQVPGNETNMFLIDVRIKSKTFGNKYGIKINAPKNVGKLDE